MKNTARNLILFSMMTAISFLGITDAVADPLQEGSRISVTKFDYQSELTFHGAPADGVFDFEFTLYDKAQGGDALERVNQYDKSVSGGIFNAHLEFSNAADRPAGEALWVEIAVREAGSGPFTVLKPRQRMKGATSTCTVNSDLVVSGNLQSKATFLGFVDEGGNKKGGLASLIDGHLHLMSSNTYRVGIDEDGNFGIGNLFPSIPLSVVGGTDANLSSGSGFVEIRDGGASLVIDQTEIQARSSYGSPGGLYLNHEGGEVFTGSNLEVTQDVSFGGALDFGGNFTFPSSAKKVKTCENHSIGVVDCNVTCTSGEVIGGGCTSSYSTANLYDSYPSDIRWKCRYYIPTGASVTIQASVICADFP